MNSPITLIGCLVLALAACGGDDAEAGDTDTGDTDTGDTDSGETDSGDPDTGDTESSESADTGDGAVVCDLLTDDEIAGAVGYGVGDEALLGFADIPNAQNMVQFYAIDGDQGFVFLPVANAWEDAAAAEADLVELANLVFERL